METLWAHLLEEREATYRKLFAKLDADLTEADADQEKGRHKWKHLIK
jgi:hypothetical protein